MPFIVGVQYKTDEVRALCGGLVRVNMYKDQACMPVILRFDVHTVPKHSLGCRRYFTCSFT